jgi:hypothetical protein
MKNLTTKLAQSIRILLTIFLLTASPIMVFAEDQAADSEDNIDTIIERNSTDEYETGESEDISDDAEQEDDDGNAPEEETSENNQEIDIDNTDQTNQEENEQESDEETDNTIEGTTEGSDGPPTEEEEITNPDISVEVIIADSSHKEKFDINLPYSCTINEITFEDYKAICALEELKNLENIDDYQTTYWESYNAYTLDSINDIANAVDWSSYWSIWYNQGWSNSIDSQSLEDGSELTFYFGGYFEAYPTLPSEKINTTIKIYDGNTLSEFEIEIDESCTIDQTTFEDYKAICALEELKNLENIDDYQTTYWESYNAYTLDSINDIANALDWSSYWSIWYNQDWANSIDSQSLENGSELTFYFGGYSETYPIYDQTDIDDEDENEDNDNEEETNIGSDTPSKKFDVNKAIQFILSKQLTNGQIGEVYETDWAFIALAGVNGFNTEKELARQYLKSNTNVGNVISSLARRSMALMSLGINPHNGTSENYISNLVGQLDKESINDMDLATLTFSGIALIKSGYTDEDKIIGEITQAIIYKQQTTGAFTETVGDYTGPALEYLNLIKQTNSIRSTKEKAIDYLRTTQQSDGGFGDLYTSGWNMNGLVASGMNPERIQHSTSSRSLSDYFANNQLEDGSLNDSHGGIWATTYVLVGIQHKSWGSLLYEFDKPTQEKEEVLIETSQILESFPVKETVESKDEKIGAGKILGKSSESNDIDVAEEQRKIPFEVEKEVDDINKEELGPIEKNHSGIFMVLFGLGTLGAGVFLKKMTI